MKKFASLLMAALMLATMLCVFAVPAFADDAPTNGKCGGNLYWSISNDHTVLTFTGTGDMWDYEYYRIYGDIVPWWDYRDTVTTINFPKEISHISKYAFCYFSKIDRVWIPSDNVSLGYESFFGCENLRLMAIGTADGKLSDTITIGAESFEECESLKFVYISRALKTVEYDGFEQCYLLGQFCYGGTEQEYKDNVTVDMGSDDGNKYMNKARHYYRDDIWDTSKWCYNDIEYWHGFYDWAEELFYSFNLSRIDVGRLPACENDGNKSWQTLDGVRINEKTINWEYNNKNYWTTLPDGTTLSGTFEWQSDGYKHWGYLPNGQMVIGTHTLQDGVCTVCGGSESSTVAYIGKDGKFVLSSSKTKKIESDTRTLSGGEYVVMGKFRILDRLEVSEDSTIILMDGCELYCIHGIHVQPGRTLTITSTDLNPETMGNLIATAIVDSIAAIGMNYYDDEAIHIVICGGKVTATGDVYGAGIGSGFGCYSNTTVDIYNGIVKGTGGDWGAGIGGSFSSNCNVNIYGGTVEAQGGFDAAGIGAGYNGTAQVYISETAKVTVKESLPYSGMTPYEKGNINDGHHGGSTLSGGSLWIIIAVAVIALGGVAALVIVKKKKKPVLAVGADKTNEK